MKSRIPESIKNNDDKAIHSRFGPAVLVLIDIATINTRIRRRRRQRVIVRGWEARRLRNVGAVAVIGEFSSSKQEPSSEYQYTHHMNHRHHPITPSSPPSLHFFFFFFSVFFLCFRQLQKVRNSPNGPGQGSNWFADQIGTDPVLTVWKWFQVLKVLVQF